MVDESEMGERVRIFVQKRVFYPGEVKSFVGEVESI